jgi:uncharacterized SAM-binding protein YcdF (DUF218 family)
MNDLFVSLGMVGWKPALSMLVLPPVPLLLLIVLGVLLSRRHRRGGAALVLAGTAGLWALSTPVVAALLKDSLLAPPPVLADADIGALSRTPRAAIVVLGAGRRVGSLDFGSPDLSMLTLERLRYGLWLARRTGLPVAYSGGVAHASQPGETEAAIATRVAERDFGQRLRWAEAQSRDTNENAQRTVPLLAAAGIRHVVLVTHDFHQPRALAAFRRAAARAGVPLALTAAPMGVNPPGGVELAHYLPSGEGLRLTTIVLHEWLGRLAGA